MDQSHSDAMNVSVALSRLSYFIAVSVGATFALIGLLVAGPSIEARFFPAIKSGPSPLYDSTLNPDGSITFRVWVEKYRACKPISLDWYHSIDGDSFEPAKVPSILDLKRVNLPVGRQPSIQFIAPTSGTYFAFVTYDCGMPWQTLATWGPFEVRP